MSELKQYLEMQSEALSSKASAEDDIIHSTVSKAKAFYDSNATRSVEFRLDMLKKLKKAINEKLFPLALCCKRQYNNSVV